MQLHSLLLSLFALVGLQRNGALAFVPLASTHNQLTPRVESSSTQLYFDLGSMVRNFGKKVTASHILIGPSGSITGRGMEQDEAQAKLLELKEEIDNDPAKFAAAAEEFSSCRASMKKGGDLGEFGPGMMVGPFDKVCFEEEVGVVHGPVSTPFGE